MYLKVVKYILNVYNGGIMNQLKKIELSDAAKYSINLAITVTGLANPPLGVILGICNSLGK